MPLVRPALLALFTLVAAEPDAPFRITKLLYSDSFTGGMNQWVAELEKPGMVEAKNGILQLDVPAGATVWFRPELRGPVMIQYEATMVRRGGPNDRVSDLNCFWMAGDARSPQNLFATKRSGKFADYNQLRAYYVGQGGNTNTTTRFRRYIGDPELRPLLPEHDLASAEVLLKANVTQKIQLVANRGRIQYYNGGKLIFDFQDAAPYTRGRFGLRTTFSHIEVRDFRVYRLQ
jgi:hypothetical protein